MAFLSVCTDKGVRKDTNEDACCVEVADTPLGEVAMAIVCDGVGGLARGDVASSTVINRFADWFEGELPALIDGMVDAGRFDFLIVKAVWGAMLTQLNEVIRRYGTKLGGRLGTTFTGLIACNGWYLVAHVGDCRAYLLNRSRIAQITEDQTLVAARLARGEITEAEAALQPKNVILQSVGTERTLKPVFYEGAFARDDLFVICCDGAYNRTGNDGVWATFGQLDYTNEAALLDASRQMLVQDINRGEKDNLTVVCLAGALEGPRAPRVSVSYDFEGDDEGTMVLDDEEADMPTIVAPQMEDEDGATAENPEDVAQPMPAVTNTQRVIRVQPTPLSQTNPASQPVAPAQPAMPVQPAAPHYSDDDLPTTLDSRVFDNVSPADAWSRGFGGNAGQNLDPDAIETEVDGGEL